MSELYRLVKEQEQQATAIVGVTKNVGKTVTLNHLVNSFEQEGKRLGLVSAGYDGERFDRMTLKEKPRIYAPQDSYVATARACFEAAEAEMDLIEEGPLSTPLGLVCLGLVKKAGQVELAGPGSVSGLKHLVDKMTLIGAEHVLVDGAINRIASASPRVAKGTVLASGASLGPTMDDVIRKTIFRRELFESPLLTDKLLFDSAMQGLQSGNAVLLHREENEYEIETIRDEIPLLAGARLIEKCREDTAALVFDGALVDNSLQDIMDLFSVPPFVIVQDATRLFISPEIFYRFLNQGGKIFVLNQIKLIAVTLNPADPGGRSYDPQMFLEKMREALDPCPVFDLVYEENILL